VRYDIKVLYWTAYFHLFVVQGNTATRTVGIKKNKICFRRKINGNLSLLEYFSDPISYDENYVIALKYLISNIQYIILE